MHKIPRQAKTRLVANGLSHAVRDYLAIRYLQDGVQCQHGPRECELNRILNCAVHLNYDQNVWFPFAKCIESTITHKQFLEPAEPCAAETGINYTAVHDCATGTHHVQAFADSLL